MALHGTPYAHVGRPRAQLAAIFAAYDRRGIGRVPGKHWTEVLHAMERRKVKAEKIKKARGVMKAMRGGLGKLKGFKKVMKRAQGVVYRHKVSMRKGKKA